VEFYDPNVQTEINRRSGKVTGTKTFDYFAVPQEPGSYALGDYISWIFFNTRTEKYDTLKSDIVLNITGESLRNDFISSNGSKGGIYDHIASKSNQLQSRASFDMVKVIANVLIVAMLVLTGWLVFRK